MKIAFFYGKQPQATLTKWFTGSTAYHVGFTDMNRLWDMNLLRRRRVWDAARAGQVLLVDCPAPVFRAYLEHQLETDTSRYGVLDYLSFGLRRIFKRLRFNGKGVICSEMVAADLKACGWVPPPGFPEVPSPGDLEEALLGRRDAISSTR